MKQLMIFLLACATFALAGCAEHGNVQLNYAGLERSGNDYALTTRIEECKKQHAALDTEAATQLCEQLVNADADHVVNLDARIRASTNPSPRPCTGGGFSQRIGRRYYYNPPRDGSCDALAGYWNYGNSLPVYAPQGGDYDAMGTAYDPRLWAQVEHGRRSTVVLNRDRGDIRALAKQVERNRRNNEALRREIEQSRRRNEPPSEREEPPKGAPPEVPASQ